MDTQRFEILIRSLSAAPSRRGLLAGLTSWLLAAVPIALAGDGAVAKKKKRKRKKKHKDKHKKKQPTPARQTVTLTFANDGQIAIPGTGTAAGIANPYPSLIEVSGFTNGIIADVNVFLNNFNYSNFPNDVDVLLAATHIPGRNAIVMSDVGADPRVDDVNLVLDDQAPTPLSANDPLTSGTYQPTNRFQGDPDTFPDPAPIPIGNSSLSTFNGQDPNGTWQLFVVDDTSGDTGTFAGGWSIQITAEVDV